MSVLSGLQDQDSSEVSYTDVSNAAGEVTKYSVRPRDVLPVEFKVYTVTM